MPYIKSAVLIATSLVTVTANAQWRILASGTSADLNSVDAVSNQVAWAAGAGGVVLRTENGRVWHRCALPRDAADLDFRSIQGFDAHTAVVMSRGNGRRSSVYKTTDACATWVRVFENPSDSGSFQSLHRLTALELILLGDPAGKTLSLFRSHDAGRTWFPANESGLDIVAASGAVVAGTASMTNVDWLMAFGTAGKSAVVYTYTVQCKATDCSFSWVGKSTPVGNGSAGAMAASVAGRTYAGAPISSVTGDVPTSLTTTLVAVGGDSARPETATAVAVVSSDSGKSWKLASAQPGGFRSAVAFDPKRQCFVAVGYSGTDLSCDDGISWHPLHPSRRETTDADKHWRSLSLPYAVGMNGRIGVFDEATIQQPAHW